MQAMVSWPQVLCDNLHSGLSKLAVEANSSSLQEVVCPQQGTIRTVPPFVKRHDTRSSWSLLPDKHLTLTLQTIFRSVYFFPPLIYNHVTVFTDLSVSLTDWKITEEKEALFKEKEARRSPKTLTLVIQARANFLPLGSIFEVALGCLTSTVESHSSYKGVT